MAVTVDITVQDIAGVLALYDKIEVRRSFAGVPYTDAAPITAAAAAAATITGTTVGPFHAGLNGLTLLLRVDGGAEQTVTFASPDPISITLVVSEVNTQTTGLTATDSSSSLKMVSDTTGTSSKLEITGGTGLTVLGLTQWDVDYGEAIHVPLVAGTTLYTFTDTMGYLTYKYQWRFVDTVRGTYSGWYPWVAPTSPAVVTTNVTIGTIKLANSDSKPLAGVGVHVKYVQGTLIEDNYFIAGAGSRKETDSQGMASFNLVEGAQVDVVVEGTSQIRRITVPTGSTFDLMDETLVEDDAFQIQTLDVPAAVRRS